MARQIEIQTRFNDLDGYGHVNNSEYLSYMEVARSKCYHEYFQDSIKKQKWYILTSAEIQYKKMITEESKVFIKLWISEVKGALFTFTYIIHDNNGTVYSTAKSVHAVYDPVKEKPIRVPKEVADLLEEGEGVLGEK